MSEKALYSVTLPSVDGFDLQARVVPDEDFDATTSFDSALFAEHIAAWKRDEWSGVGVIVEASRDGITLGDASIWGSEYGTVDGKHVQPIGDDGTDHFGYLTDLTNEALAAAKKKLAEIS